MRVVEFIHILEEGFGNMAEARHAYWTLIVENIIIRSSDGLITIRQ